MRLTTVILAFVFGASCGSPESTEEIITRVRAEVYVDAHGGSLDVLQEVCDVDVSEPVGGPEFVERFQLTSVEAVRFACPEIADYLFPGVPGVTIDQ